MKFHFATLLATLALAAPLAAAQPVTAFWYQSDAGDYVGQGATALYQHPSQSVTYASANSGSVTVSAGGWTVAFSGPGGAPLNPGAYESAARGSFAGRSPGLQFGGNGRGCNTITGRFVVHEHTRDVFGTLISFAANFEQHCEGGGPASWGEVRVSSPHPFTHNKPANSTTPDALAFRSRDLAMPGTVLESDWTTIYGTNAPAAISITGGEYSISGGAYTSAPGSVNPRDRLRLRVTASSTPGATVTAVLSVGDVNAAFSVRTYQPGDPLTGMWYRSTPGDWVGQGKTVFATAPDWSFSTSSISASTLFFNGSGPGTGTVSLELDAPDGLPLDVGPFEMAARYPFNGTSPGIDFSAGGGGCNRILGRFAILEIEYGHTGLSRLAVNFEQRCEETGPPLYGEVRLNSTIPFTFMEPPGSTMPDAFAFHAVGLMPPNAYVLSNYTSIYGINAPAPVSITGGEYSVNGGPYTSAAGTFANGDWVRLKALSSSTPGATATAVLTVGGMSASFAVTTYREGEPLTALWFDSTPGDYIGGGQMLFALPPQWLMSISETYDLTAGADGPGGRYFDLRLRAPPGQTLAPGAYEMAARAPFAGASPGVDFSGDGRGCNTILGRFAILELERTGSTITRLAVNFEQRCEVGGPPLYGEYRLNSTRPLSYLFTGTVTMPDPFALVAPAGPAKPGASVTTAPTTIYGINAPASISITGGEYSVNGGAFTTAPGTVSNRDRVVARLVASSTPGASSVATLTVGGRSASFGIQTYQPGMQLSGLFFRSSPGDWIGAGSTRTYWVPPNVMTHSASSSEVAVNLTVEGGAWWSLHLAAASGSLAVGTYENARRWPFQSGSPGLDFSGDGRGCNQLSGRFVLRELARKADGSIDRLAVDFEQRCENSTAPLFGEVRINSTVPFSDFEAPPPPPGGIQGSTHDFNRDGKPDLLWSNTANGATYVWYMNGPVLLSDAFVAQIDPSWKVQGIADFNADGKPDIVWRNSVSGATTVWLLDGAAFASNVPLFTLPPEWVIQGVADFNGDAKPDFLLRHTGTGVAFVWFFDNTTPVSDQFLFGIDPSWKVEGVADVSGDGQPDLLFRSMSSGLAFAWNTQYAGGSLSLTGGSAPIFSIDPVWEVVQMADWNADGKADLVFRSASTGVVFVWYMNGTALAGSDFINQIDPSWEIVPRR